MHLVRDDTIVADWSEIEPSVTVRNEMARKSRAARGLVLQVDHGVTRCHWRHEEQAEAGGEGQGEKVAATNLLSRHSGLLEEGEEEGGTCDCCTRDAESRALLIAVIPVDGR